MAPAEAVKDHGTQEEADAEEADGSSRQGTRV